MIPDDTPPPEATQRAAYESVRAEAAAVPDEGLARFRANDDQAYRNALVGDRALAPRAAEWRGLPGVPANLLERLVALALALLYVSRRIALLTGRTEAPPVDFDAVRLDRMLLLRSYEAAALAGLVPAGPFEVIEKGRGAIDSAQDVIDLVQLFRTHEKALAGVTPVKPERLEAADRRAHAAREELALEGNLKAKPVEELAALVLERDRIWTLLVKQHGVARRVGAFLFGEALDAHVPTLQSRTGLPRVEKKDAPVTPPTA